MCAVRTREILSRTDGADGASRGSATRWRTRSGTVRPRTANAPTTGPGSGAALELLVHGVGGTTPEQMLDDPRTVRVTGDDVAAVFRRADDAEAERDPVARRTGPVPEAYVWCNLTSGNGTRALWLLLLPFMVVNLAHWMRPGARGRPRAVRLYGLLVRLAGLSLTVLLVAAACEVALDLTAWQCAGTPACAARHSWLGFLTPGPDGGWWSAPGRRLALAALVPAALTGLLWFLSLRTWSAYESQQPMSADPEPEEDTGPTALSRPGFWYGRRLVARLRAAHTAAALLTVAAAVGSAAARYDREPGGPAVLAVLGVVLEAALAAGACAVVWVVCRRGRTERRLDGEADRLLVRWLPLAALVLLALTALYAGWERSGWESSGRLPGNVTFGALTLAQGLVVIVLAGVAHALHRTDPDRRAALRGLAGPAVAMLACALGGVMSGGVSQRVSDWLDGTRASLPGPPVLLTWQASVIPRCSSCSSSCAAGLPGGPGTSRGPNKPPWNGSTPGDRRPRPHPPYRVGARHGRPHRPGTTHPRRHLRRHAAAGRRRPRRRAGHRADPGRRGAGDASSRARCGADRAGPRLLADRPRFRPARHLGPPRLQGRLRPAHHRDSVGRRHLLAARRAPLRAAPATRSARCPT